MKNKNFQEHPQYNVKSEYGHISLSDAPQEVIDEAIFYIQLKITMG